MHRPSLTRLLVEWLNNTFQPSVQRFGKELLARLVQHTRTEAPEDLATVANLLRVKVKPTMQQFYIDTFFQLLRNHALYALHALRVFIASDVLAKAPLQPPNLQPQNTKMLVSIVKCMPALGSQAEYELGQLLQDLAQVDDYRAAHLRAVLRTLSPRELNVVQLCRGVMAEPRLPLPARLADPKAREAWLLKCAELVTAALMFTIPVEAAQSASLARQSREFKVTVAKVQKEAVAWCQHVVLRHMPPVPQLFAHLLKRVLFLLPPQAYLPDGAADEERARVVRWLCNETPLFEDTLVRLLHMHSADLPLSAADVLEMCEALMRRAAALSVKLEGMFDVQNTGVLDLLLALSVVRRPGAKEGARLLAISARFWQAALLCVLLAPFNAASAGNHAWTALPTVRALMEMLITRSWRFPAARDAHSDAAAARDAALAREEGEALDGDMMFFDPAGAARAPPPAVLRRLQALDDEFGLGLRLAASRSPDFLSALIRRQLSAGRADDLMRWLAPLLHAQGDAYVTLLPVAPLCELLMHTTVQLSAGPAPLLRDNQQRIAGRLLQHVKEGDARALVDLFAFFLSRLAAPALALRAAAKRCLHMLLCDAADDDAAPHPWLQGLSQLCTQHVALRAVAVRHLLAGLQREASAAGLTGVLHFAAQYAPHPLDGALALAQLLTARAAFVAPLLDQAEFYAAAADTLLAALRAPPPEPRPALPLVQLAPSLCVPLPLLGAGIEVLASERCGDAKGAQLADALFPPAAAAPPMLLAPDAPPAPFRLSEAQALALLRSPVKRLAALGLGALPDAALLRLLAHSALSLSAATLDAIAARLAALPDTAWYAAATQLPDDELPRIILALHARSPHAYGVAPPNAPLLARLYKLHAATSATPLPQAPAPAPARSFFAPPPLVAPPQPMVLDGQHGALHALNSLLKNPADATASLDLAAALPSLSVPACASVAEGLAAHLRASAAAQRQPLAALASLLVEHMAARPDAPASPLAACRALIRPPAPPAPPAAAFPALSEPAFEERVEEAALRHGDACVPPLLALLDTRAAPLALDWLAALTAGRLPSALFTFLFATPAAPAPAVLFLQSLLLQRAPAALLDGLCRRLLTRPPAVAAHALSFLCAHLQPEHRRRDEEEQQQRRPLPTIPLPASAPLVLADLLCDAAAPSSAALHPSALALLLALLRLQHERVAALALHLSHRPPSAALRAVQEALYLAFPELAAPLLPPLVARATGAAPSQLDGVLHRVIKELLGTELAPAAYAVSRRLGAAHPQLVARYLPILAMHVQSILRNSRTAAHVTAHAKFLLHLLGLLDVLRPHVFTVRAKLSVCIVSLCRVSCVCVSMCE